MKVTIFTKKSPRHKYLINSISGIVDNVYVVEENISFKDRITGIKQPSKIKKKYFNRVTIAEKKIFKKKFKNRDNIKIIKLRKDLLSRISLKSLNSFLKSDLYIVFGSSYIKGNLINFLIKKKTINIHMGISPYYRGTDCNFWALYDNNLHLVGGTVHLISKGLDSGPIIFHTLAKKNKNPYLYTMSAVKLTIDTLVKKIRDKKLNLYKTIKQKKKLQIRYTRKSEFTDKVIKKFMKNKVKINKINNKLFKSFS